VCVGDEEKTTIEIKERGVCESGGWGAGDGDPDADDAGGDRDTTSRAWDLEWIRSAIGCLPPVRRQSHTGADSGSAVLAAVVVVVRVAVVVMV
jgi:hypothetical protein